VALRAATRASPLAVVQTRLVASLLEAAASAGLEVLDVPVQTTGDLRQDVSIAALGGQGVFVKEVQVAVLDGRADIAVHSAKDLPSTETPGLMIAAVARRGDPRDGLVGCSLAGLPPGGRVGTGSPRRRAQLAALRPDLEFGELRGNMATRLAKASDFDAVVVAVCALERLDRQGELTEVLEPDVMLPQVGQGALAVECRTDDLHTRLLLAAIDHEPTRRAVEAERAFLAGVGGGCDRPVAAYATATDDGTVALEAMLADATGAVHRDRDVGRDPAEVGEVLARRLLAATAMP